MTARPNPTGERDAIGRPIKVSDRVVDGRATAPPPATPADLEVDPLDGEVQATIDEFARDGVTASEARWVLQHGVSHTAYLRARSMYSHAEFVQLRQAGHSTRDLCNAAVSGATAEQVHARVEPGFRFDHAWHSPSPTLEQQREVLARGFDQDDYMAIRRVGGLNHQAAIEVCELGVTGHLFRETAAAYMPISEIRDAAGLHTLVPEREYQHLRDQRAVVDARVRAWLEIRRYGKPQMLIGEYAALSPTDRLTAIDNNRRGNHL